MRKFKLVPAKAVAKNKPLKVDRSALKMMFATGKSLQEISDATGVKIGTLGAWSSRDNWAAAREAVQETVKRSLDTVQSLAVTMADRGKLWPDRVAKIADKAMGVIENEEIIDLRSADKVITLTDKVDKVARRSYGLDEENRGNTTVVNLGFLQDVPPKLLSAEVVESEVTESCQ